MPGKAITTGDNQKRLVALAHKIDQGKSTAAELAEFRRLVRDVPGLWAMAGDMARQAEHALIDALPVPTSARESMRAGLAHVRRDLGHPDAPPLERLLIDEAALCWLRLSVLEYKHATLTSRPIGIADADYWDRTLSAALRRFVRAVEAVARVRRLLRPGALQVNVGETVNAVQMTARASQARGGGGG